MSELQSEISKVMVSLEECRRLDVIAEGVERPALSSPQSAEPTSACRQRKSNAQPFDFESERLGVRQTRFDLHPSPRRALLSPEIRRIPLLLTPVVKAGRSNRSYESGESLLRQLDSHGALIRVIASPTRRDGAQLEATLRLEP